ncbi:MAG: protease pro-enzyme activation domain-containing protein [Verrucomicrobiota bacterium]
MCMPCPDRSLVARSIAAFRAWPVALFLLQPLMPLRAAQMVFSHGALSAITAGLNPVSRLPESESLNLVIGLPLRNRAILTNLLSRLYDPASADFHHYLTPQQFAKDFGPTEADYQAVKAFAEAHGLTVTAVHPNRTLLDVQGTVRSIEATFHTQLAVYRHPSEPRIFYSPAAKPWVDVAVPVLSVAGLDNYSIPRPKSFKLAAIPPASKPTAKGGSGIGGTYFGNDFRNAYVPGVTLDGSGQIIGLLEFDGYYTNDIISYAGLDGITNVPLQNVLLDGFNGLPGNNDGEVSLDIELALAMAPGLAQVMVYEGGSGGFGDDLLNRMATDDLAKQISNSWDFGIDPNTEQIFQEFAAQGQSFFNASGDSDAYFAGIPEPDDDPYITIVGGTSLTTASPGQDWAGETTWNQGNGIGSGGGISATYLIPSWQQAVNLSASFGSSSHRNIPDVSMVADNIQVIYDNGTTNGFYGTSCAAPLWAGFMALVNQQAASASQPPAGFLNPAIYAIGASSNYSVMFHDISTGNNFSSSSPNLFPAVPGYDLCTGWGTPNGSNLINALSTPEPLYITPYYDAAATGPVGGPFNPAVIAYTFTNFGSSSLNWELSNPANWLSLSATSGILNPGQATTVTVSLNSAGAALPIGFYTNVEYFTNQTDGSVQSRRFNLQVWASLVQNGGFETGDFSGWTESGNFSSCNVVSGTNFAFSGDYGAELGPGGSLGYLSQVVTTSPGQVYLLSLWLDSPDGKTPNEFAVNWSGTNLFDQVNLKKLGWTNLQYLVVACASNAVLQLGFRDDPSFLGLDDVVVAPVPAPLFLSVVPVGNQILLTWKTFAGIKYQIQWQTNLLQTNWLDLGIAITATNSSLVTSEAASSGPQRFYRLLLLP